MKRLVLLWLVFGYLAGNPAFALTVSLNGTHSQASSTTNLVTTVNDCPVGSVSFLALATNTAHLSSVADSAGNTYSSPQDITDGTNSSISFSYAVVTTDLPSSGTITATLGSATSSAGALCIKNGATANSLDKQNNTATASSVTTSPSVSTGTLSQASEAVILIVGLSGAGTSPACTNGALESGAGSTTRLILCNQVVSSNASVSNTATWTTSLNAVADIVSFKGLGLPPGSLSLLGVGR